MSVYRVNKTRDFTVMGNTHLRDKNLSLKAVGLLSKMLSFNDGWQFSTRGLAAICKEGPDAILSALKELEKNGYLVRHRGRDSKGRLVTTEFDIFESPQACLPRREKPHTENPDVDSPDVENPHRDNPAQINTIQVTNQERNTLSKNNQSINLDGMDRMDERSEYAELIRENLDYDILSQDPKFDKDRVQEIMNIMLDVVCSTAPTIRINGEDMPQEVVKSRFLKLNSSHIEYVIDVMNKNPSDMRAIYRKDFIPPEKLYPLMGQNIKRLRANHKMTQAQLAELIDMDQKQISHIETGRSREKLSVYLRIANVFGVSIDHFLAEALLIDQEELPADALAGDAEQTFLREVIHAMLHYLKEKET